MSSGPTESDEDFDARYVAYFNRQDIDGWEVRKVGATIGWNNIIAEHVLYGSYLD